MPRRGCGFADATRKYLHHLNVAACETAQCCAQDAKKKDKAAAWRKKRNLDAKEWETEVKTKDEDEDVLISNFKLCDQTPLNENDDDGDAPDDSDNSDQPLACSLQDSYGGSGGKGKGKAQVLATNKESGAHISSTSGLNGPLPPCSIRASGLACFEFIHGLCSNPDYQKLVEHHHSKVHILVLSMPSMI